MVPKITWKVQAPPTGPYRSFFKRGWPDATFPNGSMAARIECADDYVPALVREGKHGELTLYIADYRDRGPGSSTFRWARVVARFKTLDDAKAAVPGLYEKFPEYLPKDIR